MENDGKTLVIKCNNTDVHPKDGEGNVLMFLRGNSIFIKCGYHKCKRWNRIFINIPGVTVDFSNARFLQKKMPMHYHFDANKATVVIEDS